MHKLTPKGGDGAYFGDAPLRLGEIYGFTGISEAISHELNIPRHWYGIIQAFLPERRGREAIIEIQMLPLEDYPAIQIPLQYLLSLIQNDIICVKHFPMGNLDTWNNQLKQVMTITEEHIELISDNPELIEDWKIYCLYQATDERVVATYNWLTAQTDWFETDPDLIDWILLTDALVENSNHPGNDSDSDDDGSGNFPIPAGQ
jgi:hypothetical protein